ncbi:hypothetical protein HD554DRAFT_285949 [Boletus coccyginus]|nr:hypothetical protein HD554DRAFT_285949 [Boletus coccyginus]
MTPTHAAPALRSPRRLYAGWGTYSTSHVPCHISARPAIRVLIQMAGQIIPACGVHGVGSTVRFARLRSRGHYMAQTRRAAPAQPQRRCHCRRPFLPALSSPSVLEVSLPLPKQSCHTSAFAGAQPSGVYHARRLATGRKHLDDSLPPRPETRLPRILSPPPSSTAQRLVAWTRRCWYTLGRRVARQPHPIDLRLAMGKNARRRSHIIRARGETQSYLPGNCCRPSNRTHAI